MTSELKTFTLNSEEWQTLISISTTIHKPKATTKGDLFSDMSKSPDNYTDKQSLHEAWCKLGLDYGFDYMTVCNMVNGTFQAKQAKKYSWANYEQQLKDKENGKNKTKD